MENNNLPARHKGNERKEENKLVAFEQFAKGEKELVSDYKNCVIYTRVSGKEQELGYSLDIQIKECTEFAQKGGLNIMGCFGGKYESAKNDERKEFSRMLSYIKKSKEKINYIIVHMVDRFSRSGANAIYIKEQLKEEKIYILSVKQPTDTTTSSGDFQQNIQIIFSHYDNQVRKERCMAGTKEALLRGDWCAHLPLGYDKVEINKKKEIVVNNTGKLLKKAFLWKANEQVSSEECRARLAELGLKISHQRLSVVFKNPFYCGLLSHNLLEGKVIEGNHEKLISKELFLKVNEVQNKNNHGYKQTPEQINIPLKQFFKCDCCNTGLTGYMVRKKNKWYYKCRIKGCKNNKSAQALNDTYKEILEYFVLDQTKKPLLKEMLKGVLASNSQDNQEDLEMLKGSYNDLEKKIEKAGKRLMDEEIPKELYVKYTQEYKEEKEKIAKKLEKFQSVSSNFDELAEFALNSSANVCNTWDLGDYKDKQKLQYSIFPKGLRYNRKIDAVLTEDYSPLYSWIALKQQEIDNKKSGIPKLNLSYAALVARTRIELVFHP